MPSTRAPFGLILAALLAPACAERPAPDAAAAGVGSTTGTGTAARAATSGPGAKSVAAALPFIENDAPRALAEAKRRGVPLFVEAWAPW